MVALQNHNILLRTFFRAALSDAQIKKIRVQMLSRDICLKSINIKLLFCVTIQNPGHI